MNTKYIIIVLAEPYSVFSEVVGKYFSNKKKSKKKIIIIGNIKLLRDQLRLLKYKIELKEINDISHSDFNKINIINIDFKYKKIFTKISSKSNEYIENSFKKSLKIIFQKPKNFILINGPISKKHFLKKKYLGLTEYLSKKTKSKNEVMLIYNDKISVVPITTHIPLKKVVNKITKEEICKKISEINSFYKNILKKKVKIAILGLNPHCETTDKFSEEEKIILPSIKFLRKNSVDIDGPFSADTFFLKKNINKYDVAVGMYHDQVLTPIKTLYNFKAINITVGLPFVRISPDHGPNSDMLGKNKSDPSSFYYAMKFAENNL